MRQRSEEMPPGVWMTFRATPLTSTEGAGLPGMTSEPTEPNNAPFDPAQRFEILHSVLWLY